jgi:L-fuconolactonase
MAIIDSQVHVYEANTPQRPWHSVPNWPAHVTGDEMVAAMDTVGVDGAILISAFSMYQYDASYAVDVHRAHPGRFALVKPVNPDDPAVAEVIADWKHTPGTVGIRIMMTQEAGRAPNDPGLDRILRAAVRHDFPVNMLCWGNVDAGRALIDRHPDTRFILDPWGFDRCLWGTDWTRAFAVVNYEQAVEPFRLTDRLTDSERAMLMGGACAKAYGWSPQQG